MADRIHIQMMDKFSVYINDQTEMQALSNSRKGMVLIECLILARGRAVPNQRLLSTIWPEENSTNPAISLKTLVSRMRAALNKISDGLGNCIVANRGAYRWEMIPELTVDVYQIEDIYQQLAQCKNDPQKCKELTEELIKLYRGDLLQNSEQNEWIMPRSVQMHNTYIKAIDEYVRMLEADKDYDNMIRVCRQALDVDEFNEQMHIHLMSALMETKRNNEALMQYKYASHLQYRYLGTPPSEAMQEFYKQIVNAGRTLEFNMETIQGELLEAENQQGAFVCDYDVFKEIFNLQIRSLERLKTTMFLGLIMVSDLNGQPLDSMRQASIMGGLMDILKKNLRKGDAITQFSPTMVAVLLPTVDYKTVRPVMERIRKLFYCSYPNSEVKFDYRAGPLKSAAARLVEEQQE